MQAKGNILKLKGKVQHYAWGGHDFLPSLLDIKNDEQKPFAEYWMGAHSSASAEVEVDGNFKNLNELVLRDPNLYIGENVNNKFGELPFLFKILDVEEMLSIQVHPTKEEAIKGFEAEEIAGIAIDDPQRNYKDRNHKPEVMVALSDFWLLHGFKKEEELKALLQQVPEFNVFYPDFVEQGYYGLYKEVMEMSQEKVDDILLRLVKRNLSETAPSKLSAAYWVQKLYTNKNIDHIDRGVFSIYFFNIVQLSPGEGIFQGAGVPHAYLEGQNVELMANSDNVLRGGLTTKHVDVKELLKHTLFEAVEPKILKGDLNNKIEWNYPCPVDDFGISAFQLNRGQEYSFTSFSGEIYLVISGTIATSSTQSFSKGESFYVLPQTNYSFTAVTDCLLYKAFVPQL
ncbi:MAG TPA: mannose-6-phosphate isomerase, class I [Segetibacter sp.]|jgi:mannose-6-phosphate isomerase